MVSVTSSGNKIINLWEMGPASTSRARILSARLFDLTVTNAHNLDALELQANLCDFFHNEVFNLKGMEGIPLGGGSQSNLFALHIARCHNRRPLVLCSDLSHKSIAQAGEVTQQTVRPLYCDPNQNFRVPREDLIKFIQDHGEKISCLVVTMGTTQLGTTNDFPFDPEIAALLKAKGIWLHVDAAMGIQTHLASGNATTRLLLDSADSMMTDPHKFVGITNLSLLFVKSSHMEEVAMSDQHYFPGMRTKFGTTFGVQPLAAAWYTIEDWGGLKGVQAMADKCRYSALHLAAKVAKSGYSFVTPPETSIVTIDMGKKDGKPLEEHECFSIPELAEARARRYIALLEASRGLELGQLKVETPEHVFHGLRVVITPKREITKKALDQTRIGLASLARASKMWGRDR